jgi:hypothetical protein
MSDIPAFGNYARPSDLEQVEPVDATLGSRASRNSGNARPDARRDAFANAAVKFELTPPTPLTASSSCLDPPIKQEEYVSDGPFVNGKAKTVSSSADTPQATSEEMTMWLFYKLNVAYMNLNQLPVIFKSVYGIDLPWLGPQGELQFTDLPVRLRCLLERRRFENASSLLDRSHQSNQWEASPYFIKPLDEHSHVLNNRVFGRQVAIVAHATFERRVRTLLPDNSRLNMDLLLEMYESLYGEISPEMYSGLIGEDRFRNENPLNVLLKEINSEGLEVGKYYLTIVTKHEYDQTDEFVVNYQRLVSSTNSVGKAQMNLAEIVD